VKRPSFQFYPSDWQANSNLRRCTHEEKGIWIDVICLLHDQEAYGIARWTVKEIAQAIGSSAQKIRGLISKGVLKGADINEECGPLVFIPRSGRKNGAPVTLIPQQPGPVWYSSRMVEDEYKRVLRGEHGGAPKATPDHSPKGGIDAAPKATPDHSPSRAHASSSSSSSSSSKDYSEGKPSDGKPSKVTDPDEIIFGYGVPLLTNAGTAEKQARSFLGGLRKHHGDGMLIEKLRECMKAKPLQPLEWLAAALPPNSSGGTRRAPALENFAAIDYGQGGKL